MYRPFTWAQYSRKLREKIAKPRAAGYFLDEDVKDEMRLVVGDEGSVDEGNYVKVYLLVDEEDGQIADARFQVYGETALIGAAQILCELVLRKNYDQSKRISADLIDQHVRDRADRAAFPKDTFTHINLALGALDQALMVCSDIPLADGYVASPVDLSTLEAGDYPDWENLSHDQKVDAIDRVISQTIQPYIELDDGGVEIQKLDDLNLTIKYSGSCTSCYSATGSTLSAIQSILQAKIHPELTVTPEL